MRPSVIDGILVTITGQCCYSEVEGTHNRLHHRQVFW